MKMAAVRMRLNRRLARYLWANLHTDLASSSLAEKARRSGLAFRHFWMVTIAFNRVRRWFLPYMTPFTKRWMRVAARC